MSNNRAYWAVLMMLITSAMANDVFTGGISLKQTESLSKQIIPLPRGNLEPLLALAMRHGEAHGQFTGAIAEVITEQFGQDIPIYVDAKKGAPIKDQPGCNQVDLTFRPGGAFNSQYQPEKIPVVVCPNKK